MVRRDGLVCVWLRGHGAAIIACCNYESAGSETHEGEAFFWDAASNDMQGVRITGGYGSPGVDLATAVWSAAVQWVNNKAFITSRQPAVFVADNPPTDPVCNSQLQGELRALSFRCPEFLRFVLASTKFGFLKRHTGEVLRLSDMIATEELVVGSAQKLS